MASICSGKESWPELVGSYGEAAAALIEKENSAVTAVIINYKTPTVIGPFMCSRVRVVVDDCGRVITIPVVG